MEPKELLLDNEYALIEFENGILILTWKNAHINLAIAKQVVENRLSVSFGNKYPVLVMIKSIKDSTKEARDFLASEKGCEGIAATAIFVESILENMIATLFIYLNKPLVPTKIFKDEAKAKEWLLQFVKPA
ncbi:MAG: hypothetical protein WAQ28_17020 [Bacteroidia bacterium]